MKVFDILIYVFYAAAESKKWDELRNITVLKQARGYCCFMTASVVAFLATNSVYSVPQYRKFYVNALSAKYAAIAGIVHVMAMGLTVFYLLKKYYTSERLDAIRARYNGKVKKGTAIALYFLIFIIHIAFLMYLSVPMIALFVDKKLAWNV